MVGGTGNTPTNRAARSDRAGGGGRPVGQRHRRAVRGQSQNGELVASALCPTGCGSLWEIAPGRGRKPVYGADQIKALVDATLQTKPKGMTQWSCRLMAKHQGLSKSTVSNIWRSHNLKPHRVKTFKLSRDPKFLEKLTDVVGLYLNPPQQAIVLCVDEKSQIQALDRTQPGLP